jgi:hypothetical protein
MSVSSTTPGPQTLAAPPSQMSGPIELAPGATAKIRNPIVVAILSIITLGIYAIFWHYFVNREMADYGRARRTNELGDNPMNSLLALFPGALIDVTAIWTIVTTFQRVQAAQRLLGRTPINGWLGLVLYIVIFPAYFGYVQSGLNSAWRATGSTAAQEAPAV